MAISPEKSSTSGRKLAISPGKTSISSRKLAISEHDGQKASMSLEKPSMSEVKLAISRWKSEPIRSKSLLEIVPSPVSTIATSRQLNLAGFARGRCIFQKLQTLLTLLDSGLTELSIFIRDSGLTKTPNFGRKYQPTCLNTLTLPNSELSQDLYAVPINDL